jgi:hypothetical protein
VEDARGALGHVAEAVRDERVVTGLRKREVDPCSLGGGQVDRLRAVADNALYIGVLELALAAACLPLAILLLVRPSRPLWDTALALNAAALVAYVASRTIGLPGSTDDIGNWIQTLGVISILAECTVLAPALSALRR